MSTENLLKEINFLAHSKGVDAWVRDRLKALHKAVRAQDEELARLREALDDA